MLEVIFLGTGGGRFATVTQKRRTGGIRVISAGSDEVNMHIDPGPGALIYSLEMGLDPQKIRAILVSHAHLDHASDVAVLIEAMCHATTKKRGVLIASKSVLRGNDVCEKAISRYHQAMPEKVFEAEAGLGFEIDGINILACKAVHSDPDAIGFRFETKAYGGFAYIPDSEYFADVSKFYSGLRLLILSVLRPSGQPWEGHMTTDDAIRILDETRPEMAVITHFGMQMIARIPEKEAERTEKRTGVPTRAAFDGMRIIFGEEIHIGRMGEKMRKEQKDLSSFFG
ncbi:MBL fold metallo-hydrolase [Candidatus Bathyarchaeota archaeon]|nr:MBL fold metallo-hydrolase [Candidatus Bathyarchaeota archaeon]